MKRLPIIVGLAALCITMSWSKDNIKTLICTSNLDEIKVEMSNYDKANTDAFDVTKISYSGEYITKEDSIMRIVTSDKSFLDTLEMLYSMTLGPYTTLKGFDVTIKRDKNVDIMNRDALTMTSVIDYKIIDMNKLLNMDRFKTFTILVKDGKVKVADLQKYLEEETNHICK